MCAALAVAIVVLVVVPVTAGCADDLGTARDLEASGDLVGALSVYERVLERNPENLEALVGSALDLLLLQRYDEARILQERVIALDCTDVQTRVELGFNYLNHQDLPLDAVRVLREAASLDPTPQHLSFLAQAERVSGDVESAEATLHKALEADPSYARSYDLLIGLLEAAGRLEEVDALREYASLHGVSTDAEP